MLMRHLSIAYNDGGLSALIRQGADCNQILTILQKSYEAKGFSDKEVDTAIASAKAAEKSAHGRIARIQHEKFEPALDYFLFNMKSNLVVTPTKCYIRGNEDVISQLGYSFKISEEYDDIWRIEGKTDDVIQEFRKLTK